MQDETKAALSMRKLRSRRCKAGFREVLIWLPEKDIEEFRALALERCADFDALNIQNDLNQMALFPDD